MLNCIKKNLGLVAEGSVLSLEISGTHLASLRPYVGGPLAKIGKEVYDLGAAVCRHLYMMEF